MPLTFKSLSTEQIHRELGYCDNCGKPLLDNVREVAECLVTYRIDLTQPVNPFWDQEFITDMEEHLHYECRQCLKQLTPEQEHFISDYLSSL